MSKESISWLNTNTLIGCTDKRGTAWHWRAQEQGERSNHYPGAIPVEDVQDRLFGWQAESRRVAVELPAAVVDATHWEGGLPRRWAVLHILAGYEKWGGIFGVLAAHEKDSGAFIGWFILRPEPGGPLDEVELGYRLRQAAWGKGYATEGSRALLGAAFKELGVRLVWAETMSVNHDSRKVMEKLKMTLADTIPTPPDMQMIGGSEHGGVRYEIAKEQWEQR